MSISFRFSTPNIVANTLALTCSFLLGDSAARDLGCAAIKSDMVPSASILFLAIFCSVILACCAQCLIAPHAMMLPSLRKPIFAIRQMAQMSYMTGICLTSAAAGAFLMGMISGDICELGTSLLSLFASALVAGAGVSVRIIGRDRFLA